METAVPVKIVLELRSRAEAREQLEDWIRGLLATACGSGSLEGSSVLADGDRRFVLLRFATPGDLRRWQASPEVADHVARGAPYLSHAGPVESTGLETWFALPGTPAAAAAPARWKMAVLAWVALVPQIYAVSLVLPRSWPAIVNIAATTAVTVAALTWIVMPRLTRLLAHWLYPQEAAP